MIQFKIKTKDPKLVVLLAQVVTDYEKGKTNSQLKADGGEPITPGG